MDNKREREEVTTYPIPTDVGRWGSRAEFDSCRPEDGQWVHWQDRVALVLEGRYDEVTPLHVELSPTYLCNFACPWCSCRSARQDWSDIDIFNRPDASPGTVMSRAQLLSVVDQLVAARVDIQWVGGEPTMHPHFVEAARRAAEGGLRQCLFTNGSLLPSKKLRWLLEDEFVFIRFSLDAVSEDIHRRHHDYAAQRTYHERVLRNLRSTIELKAKLGAETLIGLSFVVDRVNVDDLSTSVDFITALQSEFEARAIDYVVIRPAYPFVGAEVCLDDAMVADLGRRLGPNGDLAERLAAYGIRLVAPAASFHVQTTSKNTLPKATPCRSCGWFSEIAPNGELQLCSDRYGDPESVIGNLTDAPLDAMWANEDRGHILRKINAASCASERCPLNGRGYHLNRLFSQIEAHRSEGRLDVVRSWIAGLQSVVPKPEHSFFL
ncbi:radical SAM protein [Bauldia litoralis]|uniref:Sulfatase maturation enzyme AslB, radical SAM superfamily n=1 Tax=Bauldia litoralis TaxID=665467 RepID=A0A1G6EPQ7_9HYPH|nr:radical SAM protein [Bauldia litoralis]SDB58875.1 Sulfatase maturation enzyme AslB, radical SAM superfamily [Bauldia litoralis]